MSGCWGGGENSGQNSNIAFGIPKTHWISDWHVFFFNSSKQTPDSNTYTMGTQETKQGLSTQDEDLSVFLVSTTNLVQEHWKAGCRSPLVKPLALAAQDVAATRLFLWCAERQLGNWLGRNQLGSVARSKTNRPLARRPSLSGVMWRCWLLAFRGLICRAPGLLCF